MKQIEDWFNGSKNYDEGVAIYAALPIINRATLKSLNKGKSERNFAVLFRELRLAKKQPLKAIPKPKPKKTPPTAPITSPMDKQEKINQETAQLQQKDQAIKKEFEKIHYASLPKELRPRFTAARNLFYEICDLKFELNDLPDNAEKQALEILQAMDEKDQEKTIIWKELDHWQRFKTVLPNNTSENFEDLSSKTQNQKYRNAKSSITKISQRIEILYDKLADEKNKHQSILLERKITKSESTLHQHILNRDKLKKLI